ncbi:MAG TPA: DUF1653 domain-containing protein [Legionella sp.]|nr:DUF1653 domain-containing protein [Legionella sp.]
MLIKSTVNERYRHYKTGKVYEIIAYALHSETQEELVVYKALYHCEQFGNHQMWVRPKAMFHETIIYEGTAVQRFKLIKECENYEHTL